MPDISILMNDWKKIYVTPGGQKSHKSENENLELATFSKQAQNEECSQQVWTKIQFFIFW